ncbi:conserved hypothetical protein [Leishmania mexicana MHOM/GT/2001/U1103]|uniref:BILBO1 N-terminal domain-containing protein n=1 Tax=Leishmania mexicana (strain MHOM/GT/2001/U1103) TaxID=929439 RepID=E9B0W8_LEIMU|nr:conserved hypothetical protein [Leishmania mexicana MHOM/GT/2001/U1103]CBZ28873.1 conserved hypothetical protein [Leishmania mexicana MHOM/GT/2001/U1103]
MEFPVFVASDVHGEKVNLALRYTPRTTTLGRFLSAASRCFDDVAHLLCQGSLQPFSAAYIYRDVECQWDVLEDCTQLSPFCQVYVFRQLFNERVAAIPDPLDPSQLLSVHNRKADRVTCCTGASFLPSSTPLSASTSTSPIRLAANRWGLLQSGQHPETSWARFGVPSLLFRNSIPLVHATGSTRSDRATHIGDEAEGLHQLRSADRAVSLRSVKSHRFRLQIFSPPAETQLHCQDTTRSAASTSVHSAALAALGPQTAYLKPKRNHLSDSYNAPPAPSSSPAEEVAIPRNWYSSSRHSFPNTSPRARASGQSSSQPLSVAAYSGGTVVPFSPREGRSRALSQTDKHHREMLAHREPCSGRGDSILREERARVAAQMFLGIDDLRSCLREETQQLKRALSDSLPSRVLPLNRADDGRI